MYGSYPSYFNEYSLKRRGQHRLWCVNLMESIKYSLIAACAVGIVSTLINYICGDKYAPQMKLITTLVLILTIVKPLIPSSLIPDLDIYTYDEEYLEQQTSRQFFDETKSNIEKKLLKIYQAKGMNVNNVSIQAAGDEYNYISVTKITVYYDDENISLSELESTAAEYFPESTFEAVLQGDNQGGY